MCELNTRLARGLAQLNIALTDAQQTCLLAYLQELHQWNKTINLTAVRDLPTMVSRHLLDSLTLLPFIEGQTILDLGTGAGLPGIPLSIARPSQQFYLLDMHAKKQIFLNYVKSKLHLDNVTCIHSRVENYVPTQAFDVITTRAFAPLPELLTQVQPLLTPTTQLVTMLSKDQAIVLPDSIKLVSQQSISVPFEPAPRQIAVFKLNI